MQAFGISQDTQDEIEASLKAAAPKPFVVMPDNWQALNIFLSCRTQWRQSMSGASGLCYEAVIPVLALYAKKNRRELFESIQMIEQGVLNIFHSKKGQGDG